LPWTRSEYVETPAPAPSVESEAGAATTPFEATLETEVNANNQEASVYFQYSTSAAIEPSGSLKTPIQVPVSPGTAIGGGFGGVPVVEGTGRALVAGTVYRYQTVAVNATGTTYGTVQEFTTPASEKPTVEGENVTGLTSTEATLNAEVNPKYQTTVCSARYWVAGEAENAGTTVPCTPTGAELGMGTAPVAVSAHIEHLTPGVSYDYRVIATNNTGETLGVEAALQALDLPVLTTGEAREVASGSATFTGTVNPQGAPTTYYFSYISAAGYEAALGEGAADPYSKGANTPEGTTTAAYTVGPANPLTANNLLPGTTYHYALIASNSVGTVVGSDQTFTTPSSAPPPVAVTGGALGITSGTATITGAVETQGLPTSAAFEFGSSPALGTTEGQSNLPGAAGGTPIAFAFNGYLSPGTIYYYRVVATNAQGTSYGAEQSFTTTSSPSAALSPVTLLLSDATVGEVKTAGKASGTPAKKCKKGMSLKKGKCVKHKAKSKKKAKRKGRKS
jgi:hypothetical protein